MKLRLFVICCLVAALLCGCGSSRTIKGAKDEEQEATQETTAPVNGLWGAGAVEDEVVEEDDGIDVEFPYDYTNTTFYEYENCFDYAPEAICRGVMPDGSPFFLHQQDGHHVAQAACTDGRYGYFFMDKPADGINPELQYIFKVDLTNWEIVKRSEEMYIQHANSACYNENTGLIYSVNQKPDGKILTLIDPETLEVVGTQEVDKVICAISYCPERNQYVVRLDGNYPWNFAILDADFNWLAEYRGVNTQLGRQNIFCDENYIYRLDSGFTARPGTEVILVYDWEGNYQGIYRLVIDMGGSILREVGESEALFMYDGKFYISFLAGSAANFYELDMDLDYLYW